jgi:predicted transcriptional regulator
MKPTNLGEQELQVLRFVTDNAPVTVRETVARWGEPRGLARTTILTVMERLRKKGFLTRRPAPGGAFAYLPAQNKTDLLQSLVHDFVEKTLGGSLTPFVAYLADAKNLSDAELAELRHLVASLENLSETAQETDTRGKMLRRPALPGNGQARRKQR